MLGGLFQALFNPLAESSKIQSVFLELKKPFVFQKIDFF